VNLILHVDGGSRGNPGPAGAGVVIRREDGALLHEGAYFLGRQTNNAAEYLALIHGLRRAARLEAAALAIRSDSELLVRQLTGVYRVKNAALAELFEQAQRLLLKTRWRVEHVPREENVRADELANLAMDRAADVVVFDVDSSSAAGNAPPAPSPPQGASAAARESPAPGAGARGNGQARDARGVAVRVSVARAPSERECPAGAWAGEPLTIRDLWPGGVCVHATHAIAPTVLAIRNADPAEAPAIPTMTVRCSRAQCPAVFQVAPSPPENGAG
jgi:uncharacterized repeat protein (TIGR04076 family)